MTDEQLKAIRRNQLAKKEKEVEKAPIVFDAGSTIFNLVVGGGETCGYHMGYTSGTVVRDWGDSSSSKTFKACHLIASNYYKYKDKFKWCYLDVENGNTINTKALYGFDMFGMSFKGPKKVRTVEAWWYDVYKFMESLKPDECGIYILDSLDALSSDATEARKDERVKAYDKGKEFTDGTFAMASQKFLSQEAFRGMQDDLKTHNCMLYVIGQARDNVGAGLFAPKKRVGGGEAQKFAESVRLRSTALHTDNKEGIPVSVQVQVYAEKTRHPKPFRSCQFPIVFDYGLDRVGADIDYLFDLRSDKNGDLLEASDAICWDESAKPVTLDALTDFLDEHEVLEDCRKKLKTRFNVKNIKKFIEDIPELKSPFESVFGKTMTRDELITYVEANRLEKELSARVVRKWDAFEASIATKRKPMFAVEDNDE